MFCGKMWLTEWFNFQMILTFNGGSSSRSVLPWDWIWGVRPASRWSPRETRCHHVCEGTGAQCDQVHCRPQISVEEFAACSVCPLNKLPTWPCLSRSTEAGRETSGGMWRTEKMFPAGLFTVMEPASSMERLQTTLCRAFLKQFKNRLHISVTYTMNEWFNILYTRPNRLHSQQCMDNVTVSISVIAGIIRTESKSIPKY